MPTADNTDYYAGLADGTVSESDVDRNAAPVDPAVEPEAAQAEEGANPPTPPDSEVDRAPAPVDPQVAQDIENGPGTDPAVPTEDVKTKASDVSGSIDPAAIFKNPSLGGSFSGDIFKLGAAGAAAAGAIVGKVSTARNQDTYNSLSQQTVNTDWRVTLRLAPGATYLYKDANPGLLAPLKTTNGVIFPYTPTIGTAYKANYDTYDLTHSNYRGYFYKNSYTDAVSLKATFTAQSTADAAYVLAVIHFFRSVTKMFYGQDSERGSPPPLVFLSGLGDYQFNNHPCVVSSFTYSLPADVDYISSGSPNNLGLNLQPLQNLYSTTLNAVAPTVTRLATSFLPPGAQNSLPAPLKGLLNNPTYVPSKIDIDLTLLPVQTRQQVSKQFSLQNFANGNLLKGGFW